MSFFSKLFGSKTEAKEVSVSATINNNIITRKFGRYTDCDKNKEQLANWKKANTAFEEKRYLDSFEAFLNYLGDTSIGNVKVKRNADNVEFELIQGSKIVTGIGDGKDFFAESKIATMENASIPVMRKLMSINFSLMYSKFALNDTALCMKFSSHTVDASPTKLYSALKELANNSDKQDDLLLSEFSSLKEIDVDHKIPIKEKEREVKYTSMVGWINETKEKIGKVDSVKNAGAISFLLLDLTYKIDYLIAPQGLVTEYLEKVHSIFFRKDKATTGERNRMILEEFDRLLAEPKEKIIEGLYDVKCTFAIVNMASHKTVIDFMFGQRSKVDGFRKEGMQSTVDAVYGYIVSYSFFSFGLLTPITDLLNIAMHVSNPDYYAAMGDTNALINADKSLNQKKITKAINQIVINHKKDYTFLVLTPSKFRFTSANDFIDSMILVLDKIDLRK